MSTKQQANRAPEHLSAEAKTFWATITRDFVLEAHHLQLLEQACSQLDRNRQARELVAAEGLSYRDRFNQLKANPSVSIERDSAMAFLRIMRELGLDIELPTGPRGPGRPGTRD